MSRSRTTRPPADWIEIRPEGLYCRPGGFFIDPHAPVDRAVVTHGHGDHACSGHGAVLATPQTLAIMQARYGEDMARTKQPCPYSVVVNHQGVDITLFPAG